ncbi:MAG TPA: adenylate/guanylate cyclase domain-containing protein, partial [Aestuariivirga sp.]|nr:adenylate/guanylate cyclase domain-containing protein [Aestuariivirga sp.]
MAKNERRLVPIVSLDVEGYSRLTELDETATLAAVRHVFTERVEATIGDYGGSVFKTMGDGILAQFASAVAAVEWVSGLQQQLYQAPVNAADGKTLQLRAGIVMADVVVKNDDLFGEGVNLTVRVQGCSPPGGMAISKWMHEYLTGKTDLTFVDIGSQRLKNIGHTVRVFIWHPDASSQERFANNVLLLV